MKTVVLFVGPDSRDERSWKNKVLTRSMRRVGFIDNRHPKDGSYPKPGEFWFVEIIRENLTEKGGCFILRPILRVESEMVLPLMHGMYDMRLEGDVVVLTPNQNAPAPPVEEGKEPPPRYWGLSSLTKRAILREHPGAHSIVINHGGEMWARRKPAESVFEYEARRLLKTQGKK